MPAFTAADHVHMASALRLAERGRYTCHPNPRVGCVLVRDGNVVGTGWHHRTGAAHAEVNALHVAGDAARACTAFVTLEPCSHSGKTPPCSSALIDAAVAKVVIAMLDPNPKVAGSGVAALEKAGVKVAIGLLQQEARALNRGFVMRMEQGRPFVQLKIAASLDGRTAMANGESQWITGAAARRDVQRLRASVGAVMTGIDTVLADDPSLTVRDASIDSDHMQPLRVVLDSELRLPSTAKLLTEPGRTLIFCVTDARRDELENAGAEVLTTPARNGQVDLSAVYAELAGREINAVLVEAGPTLSGSLINAKLVDELVIYQAPHIMGSETRGMVTTPEWQGLDQRLDLEILEIRKIGADMRITAKPANQRACA